MNLINSGDHNTKINIVNKIQKGYSMKEIFYKNFARGEILTILDKCISHFERLEEYEKCKILKDTINDILKEKF